MSGNICVGVSGPPLLMREFFQISIYGLSSVYDRVDQFLSLQSNFSKMLLKLETAKVNWVFYNMCRPLMPSEFMTDKLF